MTSPSIPHTVEDALRLGDGFASDEREAIVDTFARLDTRLRSFTPGTVELMLTVKDRDAPGQRTMLEARIAGVEPVLATSTLADVSSALIEVRDETIRQITDAKNQTEPRNNRRLRTELHGKRSGDAQ